MSGEERLRAYAEAIDPGAMDLNRRRSSHAVARRRRALGAGRAAMAVADAEQEALRAEVERLRATGLRHIDYFKAMRERAEKAEERIQSEREKSKHCEDEVERLRTSLGESLIDAALQEESADIALERLAAMTRIARRRGDRVAAAEAERDEVAGRLSALLCELTGGLLSKPTYPVETMRQEIEAFLERQFDADTKANLTEQGRRLASQRDDLIAQGVDPADLVVPLAPEVGGKPSHGWTCNCGECVLECTCAMTEASQRTCAAHGEDEWRAPEAAE